MKKASFRVFAVLLVTGAIAVLVANKPPVDDSYVIISWNDLGMHCANKDFANICVLPPYNNLKAQVILKGNATSLPQLVTSGFSVNYSVPGNTVSTNKTNFWDYEDQLFGVNLPPNIGLTGVGLSGTMAVATPENDHFFVDGIPVTPYQDNDLVNEDPYQLALVELHDNQNNLIVQAQPVIPVSNEINCVSSGCHSSEAQILNMHEDEGGFDPNDTPILCAECHSSNALGTPGMPGLESLSQVIHEQHGEETNDCYKCHPGPNTQCHRDIMHTMGMVCQDCHGSVDEVGQSIDDGREPWLEEPQCGNTDCHGSNYAEEQGKLFRQSRGHGGLFCSACHGSPHALYTSENDRDNQQIIALQGYAGILRECSVCHGVTPAFPGPHGYIPTSVDQLEGEVKESLLLSVPQPNPFKERTVISFNIDKTGKTYLDIFDQNGKQMVRLVSENLGKGQYQITFNAPGFAPGVYILNLRNNGRESSQKLVLTR
ncbi:MAG TPA: T9SS type A sorting domain-containing protein [Bacteroidales bacterium]|nr:T9SS type A sorting domain-containing protein [Bacteroidales bacterium]HPI85810.1 T9SS type A sorting domain-containing protein [Bacteroidales bacterium]